MSRRGFGTRFSNSNILSRRTPDITSHRRADAPGNTMWWTERRVEKLRYIMDKYNDMRRAARVLGCDVRFVYRKWRDLQYYFFVEENEYEAGLNQLGIIPSLDEPYDWRANVP